MDRICIIDQPAGIGDIFYTQKIAKRILAKNKADKVVWPVLDHFIYIKDYLKDNNIEYIKKSKFKPPSNSFIVSLHTADQRHKDVSVMSAKYIDVGLSEHDALSYFKFERNKTREKKLYDKLINKEEYVVVNSYYGSPPDSLKRDVPYDGNKQVVNIQFYKDVNLFDWCMILENAGELHMVDTSFMYIVEKLNLKSKVKKLYSRYEPANFSHIMHIPKTVNWEFTQW